MNAQTNTPCTICGTLNQRMYLGGEENCVIADTDICTLPLENDRACNQGKKRCSKCLKKKRERETVQTKKGTKGKASQQLSRSRSAIAVRAPSRQSAGIKDSNKTKKKPDETLVKQLRAPRRFPRRSISNNGIGTSAKHAKQAKVKRLCLCIKHSLIPHPEKESKGGEDAFFILENAFGVFDGVGGCRLEGIDPARYAKRLAELTAAFVKSRGVGAIHQALKYAVRKNKEQGTSTACVASLDRGHLQGVNVGDSGLIVIRDSSVVFETGTQQHEFNRPYQLGFCRGDSVNNGEFFSLKLQDGDVIVAATDGLWDNVHRSDIVRTVVWAFERFSSALESTQVKRACKLLAETASLNSLQTSGDSPFSQSAHSVGRLFEGGKVDDITVLVAKVGFAA